ncbi:MAG: ammonium transporter [Candidatus Sumerlaeia bacterium]|nr:ammonium transporter [Candidatus Sumerlaeia bacterium]
MGQVFGVPARAGKVVAALGALLGGAASAAAQDGAPTVEELAAKVAAAQMAGDNAWVMTSSAVVLMMTLPGLLLFYGGLVRTKNILSVAMQCFALAGMVSVLWALFGYSFAFSEGSPFIGGTDYLFLRGVGGDPAPFLSAIPHQTFMVFQLMFAIITPALIVGAFAERFRFKAMLPFMALWSTFVYLPLAHMVWGSGGFLNAFAQLDFHIPALDFAGGTVVHISSGVSALVCALYVGKRRGYPAAAFTPHSLVMTTIGAGLLWVGWFGFNAGSALGANALAANAFAATHFSAAAAAMSWMAMEWVTRGKPSLLGTVSGAVAGLVAVTPAAGFVTPMSGLLIGLLAGVVCWFACVKMKAKFGYDDALDVFGVHGVGGILGAILTGVFATSSVQDVFGGTPVGLLEGNAKQLFYQIAAVGVTAVLAIAGTLVFLTVVDKTIGIRPSEEDEGTGLDLVDHGEAGYHMTAD